ncbi:MAG: hypothetical protein O4861_20215 [Trichodesmium sp. St16_bin4-tuft]|uniref:Uncharacterized protein n=2 Tax=Trichodesmium erythraeum TaxID=1206 RepID=Q110P2_TRIEI|nr:hypothetical protein [Trichodesmium sp. MAG_R01]MDE5072957.1 hypothetical protein [Trichodesmium sp. St5_bin8]MDE5078786.1 hypothetical protein [Trichodesmium sp. St2_bin6]MDE5100528.1 hypothetical protein [Trichodesmium sp. St16_bin4-tuft]MDE5101451.1 hypothetical protein [Trichodesmium sp. St19_bin2]
MPRGKILKGKDLKMLTKVQKKEIKWTPKKLTLAGIGVLVPYTAILVYVISSEAPLGSIIVMIAVPVLFFGGYSLLYSLTRNL